MLFRGNAFFIESKDFFSNISKPDLITYAARGVSLGFDCHPFFLANMVSPIHALGGCVSRFLFPHVDMDLFILFCKHITMCWNTVCGVERIP